MASSAKPSFPRNDLQRIAWALLLMVGLAVLFIGTIVSLTPVVGSGPARLAAVASALILGGWGLVRGGATLESLGLRREGLGAAVLRGVAGAFGIGAVLVLLLFHRGGAEAVYEALLTPSLAERLPYLAIGVMASVLEEPLFRGYLQPLAMRRFGPRGGLLGTALLFAVVHGRALQWPPHALVGKVATGLGLGLLRGRDRSLAGPLVAHALVWFLFGMA